MPANNHIDMESSTGRGVAQRREPAGRVELGQGARTRRDPGLDRELVDAALARARAGEAVGRLPDELRGRVTGGLIDELLAGRRGEAEILAPDGLLGDLTRRLVERALGAELTDHLGYEPHAEPPGGTGNARNGSTPKTLLTDHGPVGIATPRDRAASFEPQIVRKGQSAWTASTTRSSRSTRAG